MRPYPKRKYVTKEDKKKAIALADQWFSRFIRLKYSENGLARCSTCNALKDIRYMDCGHYQKRQHLATRWEDRNALPQCKPCNGFEQGNPEVMAQQLDKIFGVGTAAIMRMKKNNAFKGGVFEIKFLAEEYRKKTYKLLREKGVKKWW